MKVIGGVHRGRKLIAPQGSVTRPSLSKLRETLFNICQAAIEGAYFLDLFAGAGAVGLEALSRGAARATFVEIDKKAMQIIEKNIQTLDEESRAHTFLLDTLKALKRFVDREERFDIIFADPPYGEGYSDKVLQFVDLHAILKEGGELFLEDTDFREFPLKTLELKSSRRIGPAFLKQYIKR
ncbi:MAG: Ribosomal RNA small subunit methyltransferase D [Chlamydiae bacterium]|nr:Ribosomal RNA small subunit methyltransferase D [Chlamydiota bacterium]